MAEDDVFVLEPPDDRAIICLCGDLIGYVVIPDDDDLATVHPCHCELSPEQLEEVIANNHPKEIE